MSDGSVPDAAVQIVRGVMTHIDMAPQEIAEDACAALAHSGWLHDPATLAARDADWQDQLDAANGNAANLRNVLAEARSVIEDVTAERDDAERRAVGTAERAGGQI